VQTDHGQIVAVHQLHQDSGDLQTDVKVGEGHVHLERGKSQSALGLPHDQGLVIASRNCRGSYLKIKTLDKLKNIYRAKEANP